ncbi:DNA-binding protein [Pelobacter seleniigenes]|uniref:DNA-binding protein n=1 Tax=Pelobacter seleniigenes TaxID=407188 RepID=UPI0004A74F45|nr:DNA-binding protein [Pelobacter seleniigenes]
MQPVATIETVARACEQLKRDGQKVTGRAVLAITGGSLGTVLTLIKEWRESGEQTLAPLPEEMPNDLQTAILRALGQAQAQAAEELKLEVEAAKDRETEVLDLYADAETTIKQLTEELKASQDRVLALEQEAEKTAGITTEKLDALIRRVGELEIERLQLIAAGEAARIEAARAQVNIERADQATTKCEERVMVLEQMLAQTEAGRTAAEKCAALAEQKTDSQAETIAELRSAIAELKARKNRQPRHE